MLVKEICSMIESNELNDSDIITIQKALANKALTIKSANAEDLYNKDLFVEMSTVTIKTLAKHFNIQKIISILPKPTISMLVSSYYDVQKLRIAASQRANIPNYKTDKAHEYSLYWVKGPSEFDHIVGRKIKNDKNAVYEMVVTESMGPNLIGKYVWLNQMTKEEKRHMFGYDKPEVLQALKLLSVPTDLLKTLEGILKTYADVYTDYDETAKWAKQFIGIGPVISAGLVSQLDIERTKTAGGFLRYGGWTGADDEVRRKGQKLHYNTFLKTLFWKLGVSFQKVCTKPNAIFGHDYRVAKQEYINKNENLEYQDVAKLAVEKLAKSKDGKNTDAYKTNLTGKLTDAHIDARARRHAVAVFINLLFTHWYKAHYKTADIPVPYVQGILGHTHILSEAEALDVTNGQFDHFYKHACDVALATAGRQGTPTIPNIMDMFYGKKPKD